MSRDRPWNRTQWEPHPRRLGQHQARRASVERGKRADDTEGASSLVQPHGDVEVGRGQELAEPKEQERERQEEKDGQDRQVRAQRRDKEQERQEPPQRQVYAQRERVRALVAAVRGFDAQRGHFEHRV